MITLERAYSFKGEIARTGKESNNPPWGCSMVALAASWGPRPSLTAVTVVRGGVKKVSTDVVNHEHSVESPVASHPYQRYKARVTLSTRGLVFDLRFSRMSGSSATVKYRPREPSYGWR